MVSGILRVRKFWFVDNKLIASLISRQLKFIRSVGTTTILFPLNFSTLKNYFNLQLLNEERLLTYQWHLSLPINISHPKN